MLEALNRLAQAELAWPKVGNLAPCSICERPNTYRFLGVRKGKGQWAEILPHTLENCRAQRKAQEV